MLRRLLAMPPRALGARCGARLGRADPRLAALRAESNLHPRVPSGPAPPRSPPLVAALRPARIGMPGKWFIRVEMRVENEIRVEMTVEMRVACLAGS